MAPRLWLSLLLAFAACERGGGAGERAATPPANAPAPAAASAPADAGPVERASVATPAACPPLVVAVKPDAVWVRDQNSQSVVASCGGEIDRAALALRLCTLASAAPPHCTAVEVAADKGVQYQQMITVMDLAIQVGLPDVSVTDPGSASLPLRDPPDPTDKVAPQCDKQLSPCPPRPAAGASAGTPASVAPPPAGDVTNAIVIAVPADGSISIAGKKVASAREVGAGARIEPLYKHLRAESNPDGARAVILQVDRTIHAGVITRIIDTAKTAGFSNFAFAVKKN